ncbi:MAG: hypothetical protein GX594_07660 [Pirellulaceae bacterium]|nr:hypothetical protein [Pirellulaceae bacterium]
MIPQEVKALFNRSHTCWMATADASGVPNVAPMRQLWWFDERTLVIGDLYMKTTSANVQATGRACLAAYEEATGKSWKLTGTAAYETDGPRYDMAQADLEKSKPGKRFKGVVAFTIDAVYDQVPGPNAGQLIVQL